MYEEFFEFDKKFKDKKYTWLARGRYKLNTGGKFVYANPSGAAMTPWVFVRPGRKKYCGYWNDIYCQEFGLIPTYCRFNCWKTVIKPRTCKETFQCYDVLKALWVPSKIGMDVRDYTYGAWAGFVYGDSLPEGRMYYAKVKKAMHELVAPDLSVILKRGCTEMEFIKPSDRWDEITDDELRQEEKLNDLFCFQDIDFYQAEWLRHDIMENWVAHAIKIGDPTAQEMAEKFSNDPDIWTKLVSHPVTYHDKKGKKAEKEKKAGKGEKGKKAKGEDSG